MCAFLAIWSCVGAVVFGTTIEQTAALGQARIRMPARELVARSPVAVEVGGGILEQECLALHGA